MPRKIFDDDLLPLDNNAFGDREESKSTSTTIAKSSWIRVMPGLKRNDTIRVRDYGDICVPSRIRIVNNNTYDLLLGNGEEQSGVRREDIWLNPELELKFSAISVELLQEDQSFTTSK